MSLALGAIALVALLHLFFAPITMANSSAGAIIWNPENSQTKPAPVATGDDYVQLESPSSGISWVKLPADQFDARDYAYLHIAVDEPIEQPRAILTWTSGQEQQQAHAYAVESKSRESLWLATSELRGWEGSISKVQLIFASEEGEIIRIRDFSLFPASLSRQLAALYSDWTGFVSWNRSAINSHAGVTKASSFYPAPLTVVFLGLSLLAYGVLLLVFRKRWRFNWQVVSLIFLCCWIALDLLWQNRLLQQLAETHRTFSGKTTPQKLAVGPDAQLYNFVAAASSHMAADTSRVFVSSNDEYHGLRSAYYLYPNNVFWSLRGPELPHSKHLRSGDYILMVKPTKLRLNRKKGKLVVPRRPPIDAELVYDDIRGMLVRVL